ncbi:MAG: hypothetical protein L0Y43_02615 [Methylococcaceae bacterium]|nr:hypothetical protein [Methylococcaceae bacterium]
MNWLPVAGRVGLSPALADLQRGFSLSIDGLERTYDFFVLRTAGKEPLPLVRMVHRHYGDADVMTGTRQAGVLQGLARSGPAGSIARDHSHGRKGLGSSARVERLPGDAASNPTSDDVAFVLSLLDRIAERYAVDRQRVYAVGTSNRGRNLGVL